MIRGSPTLSQENHVIAKQILTSLQKTYVNQLVEENPDKYSGKTTWARAVFEDHNSVTKGCTYNLWEHLPLHPVPACRVTKPLHRELIPYNQAGFPSRHTAHPADKFISTVVISCLDDVSLGFEDGEKFPVLTEYTHRQPALPSAEPSDPGFAEPTAYDTSPTIPPRTTTTIPTAPPPAPRVTMAYRETINTPAHPVELPAGVSHVNNSSVTTLEGRCPLISPLYLKACTSSFGPYKSLVLTSISSLTFKSTVRTYDDRVILMADIFCQMRLNLLDKYSPTRHNVLLTGELAAPYLPQECYQPIAKADDTFRSVLVKCLEGRSILDYYPNITAAGYEGIPLNPNVEDNRIGLPPAYPFAAVDIGELDIKHLVKLLRILMIFSDEIDGTKRGLFIITNLIVAVCKQGTISGQFIEKVRAAMKQDLGSDIAITTAFVGSIWGAYGQYINEKNVGPLMNHFLDNIMAEAIRLRITINQSKYQGLTMFQTIGRAMLKYPDLSWHLLERVIPQEFTNYKVALRAVGDNPYYGYSQSLDLVKAANFRNLGYLSKELLVKLNNESNLNFNRVFEAKPDKAKIIDKIILRYITEVEKMGDEKVLGSDKHPSAIMCQELEGQAREIQDLLNQNPICFT